MRKPVKPMLAALLMVVVPMSWALADEDTSSSPFAALEKEMDSVDTLPQPVTVPNSPEQYIPAPPAKRAPASVGKAKVVKSPTKKGHKVAGKVKAGKTAKKAGKAKGHKVAQSQKPSVNR